MKLPSAASQRLPEILLCILILAVACLSPAWIPYNMDEFSHYHVLGCHYFELNGLYGKLDEACGQYDLKLPFTDYLPLRSYIYIGVAHTAPFMLFWKLFGDPVAGRIQGACFLILATFLLALLVRVRWRHALLAALLFPSFCLPFILDTGTVGILICMLLGILLLLRRALQSATPGARIGLGALLGVLTFLAISIKPVFIWALPAVALWCAWELQLHTRAGRDWAKLRTQVPLFVAIVIACAVPTLLLFTALDRSGNMFLSVAASGKLTLHPRSILNSTYWLGRLVWNSANFDLRVMQLWTQPLLDFVPMLIAIVTLFVVVRVSATPTRQLIAVLLGAALVTFGIVTTNSTAWAPHHIVFAFVFLIAALALAIARIPGRALQVVLLVAGCAYWASLAARLPVAQINPDSNFDKDRLTTWLRTSQLDASSVQLHVDWGTYYLAHTFGARGQLVMFRYELLKHSDAARQSDLRRTRELAQRLHRDVVVVAREPNTLATDPIVAAELGPRVARYDFTSWSISRYRPAAE
jgi:hypothetical protein